MRLGHPAACASSEPRLCCCLKSSQEDTSPSSPSFSFDPGSMLLFGKVDLEPRKLLTIHFGSQRPVAGTLLKSD